jgi:hypothetical protein
MTTFYHVGSYIDLIKRHFYRLFTSLEFFYIFSLVCHRLKTVHITNSITVDFFTAIIHEKEQLKTELVQHSVYRGESLW